MGERNDSRCEQFDISPETIEQELRSVVCEQRQTDNYSSSGWQSGFMFEESRRKIGKGPAFFQFVLTPKAGFTLQMQIYGVYADHFAHLGRVFSATNADLHRCDRAGAECKHSYNTPSFTGLMLDCHWLIARDLCVYAGF